ncbi:MAG: S9 family peptidase [Ignavibacteriaceae bacterium]
MKPIKVYFFLLFFSYSSFFTFGQSEKKPFQLTDLRKIVNISDPQISPDGKQIAVVVSRYDWDKDSVKQEIDLIDVSNSSKRSLTFQRSSISNVRWSPDGQKLGFAAKDNGTKKTQIYILPMNGGDPVKITDSKTDISEFTCSPDGKTIAYVAQDTVPNPKEIKHHEDAFRVTDNNYMVREAVQPWHLWIVSSVGGKAKQLTKGKFSLCTDQETISPVIWSHDGKSLIFQKFPDVWDGNAWHSVIAEVDTNGNEIKTVINDEGTGMPAYSPSQNILSFMRARNGDLNNGNAVYVKMKGEIIDITKDLARNINQYSWMPGENLLLTGDKGTKSVFWNQPLNGKAEELDLGNVNPDEGNLSISGSGIIAFTGRTSMHPGELYILESLRSKPKQLTNFNDFADSLNLGKSIGIEWNGPDGFDEDGVLTYPVDYDKTKKYPLVLVIHGGPEGASTIKFSDLAQIFAGKGFFVFQPNYRGSINLGDKYQHAIFRNTGEGPGEDVMAGLNKIESMGIIDTNRIGLTGWSYGGYMTSWLNGKYPDKWKATVEGAALNDWVMDYTIAFYQTYDLYFFGGSPWLKKYWKIWREQSPIVLAENVKAPTLILGDAGDPNVPIVNSYEMYHALKDNGVNTEFYVYPVDTHFPHDIVRRTDVYKRWVDWIVKYVK